MGELREIRYSIDPDDVLRIARDGANFHFDIATIPSRREEAGVAGEIGGSLFEGVTRRRTARAGHAPGGNLRLGSGLLTDPRPGDTFRVVVEKKKLATGEPLLPEKSSRRNM